MFIEVTTLNKVFVNVDDIAFIKPNGDFCMITFKQPISTKGGNVMPVRESYEEVKQMIMEGK